jgi:hypothetical protein
MDSRALRTWGRDRRTMHRIGRSNRENLAEAHILAFAEPEVESALITHRPR